MLTINSFIGRVETNLVSLVNSNNFFMLFFCLSAFLVLVLFPHQLAGNEEHYFQLGMLRYNPDLFPAYHAVFEQGKGRIVFEYIVGFLVNNLGYTGALIFTRVLMAGLYALSLSLLLNKLNLGLLESLAIVSIFLLTGQELFGGEWLFLSIEPKTFAYFFVFLALYFWLSARWFLLVLSLVCSTYFHFLVGIFWAAFILAAQLINERNIYHVLKWGLAFSAGVLPLVFMVLSSSFAAEPISYKLSANYIYGAIRLPHHIAPFISGTVFLKEWLLGLILLVFIIRLAPELYKHPKLKKLASLVFVASAFMLVSFLLSYVDKESYKLAKFFLFRPSSLTVFLVITCVVFLFCDLKQSQWHKAYALLLLMVVSIVVYDQMRAVWGKLNSENTSLVTQELASIVDQNVSKDEIILIEPPPGPDERYTRLNREINRPTLIVKKFIPSAESDIVLWHQRLEMRNEFFERGCNYKGSEYSIKYMIAYTDKAIANFEGCSKKLYEDGSLVFLKLSVKKAL